jgi:hypothetical protein
VYQNRSVPQGAARCIINDAGNCSTHSWTFVSARNMSYGDTVIAAELYNAYDHNLKSGSTGRGFVRHCPKEHRHGSMLDCHDTDGNPGLHVGAYNGGPGATIEIHGGY